MNSKPFIVLGEAQESESEEEIDFSTILKHKIDLHKGKIVTGEAPESDDETPGELFCVKFGLKQLFYHGNNRYCFQ